ncbi:alkaline phosphatase D family protein [Streptomyces sp. NPDC006274]|uniref:alkaline phosphatase D family protein n=1 Tax=unclassified Streptomyces TaxID=2593676 RepID=UPI0033BCFE2A
MSRPVAAGECRADAGVGDRPGGRGDQQIADLLRYIKHRRITGTAWLTADVHYTSAQHYAPERAAFKDFAPFWEFVRAAGGGRFPGERARFDLRARPGVRPGAEASERVADPESPQYFGEVDIDGGSGELTVRLRAEGGTVLFSRTLQPGRVGQ